MFGRFFSRFNTEGSGDQAFESAFCCAAFFAALLLVVDTVLAVSIFVSANILSCLCAALVFFLGLVLVLRVLLTKSEAERSKPLAVSI